MIQLLILGCLTQAAFGQGEWSMDDWSMPMENSYEMMESSEMPDYTMESSYMPMESSDMPEYSDYHMESSYMPMESSDMPMESTDYHMESSYMPMESSDMPDYSMESSYMPMESSDMPMESTDYHMESSYMPMESSDMPDYSDYTMESSDMPMEMSYDYMESSDMPMEMSYDYMESSDMPMEMSYDYMESSDMPMESSDMPMESSEEPYMESSGEPSMESSYDPAMESSGEPDMESSYDPHMESSWEPEACTTWNDGMGTCEFDIHYCNGWCEHERCDGDMYWGTWDSERETHVEYCVYPGTCGDGYHLVDLWDPVAAQSKLECMNTIPATIVTETPRGNHGCWGREGYELEAGQHWHEDWSDHENPMCQIIDACDFGWTMYSPELHHYVCAVSAETLNCPDGQEQRVEWVQVSEHHWDSVVHCEEMQQTSCPNEQKVRVEHEFSHVNEHGHEVWQDVVYCEELHRLDCGDNEIRAQWEFQGHHEEMGHDIWEPVPYCVIREQRTCGNPDAFKMSSWDENTHTETFHCVDKTDGSAGTSERSRTFHFHDDHHDEDHGEVGEEMCHWVDFDMHDGCHDDPEGFVAAEGFDCAMGIEMLGGIDACDQCHEIGDHTFRMVWQLCPATCDRCDALTYDCQMCTEEFVTNNACFEVFENGQDPLSFTSQECVSYCTRDAYMACFPEEPMKEAVEVQSENIAMSFEHMNKFYGAAILLSVLGLFSVIRCCNKRKGVDSYTPLLEEDEI